jgi:hypothetical protein
MVAVQRFVFDVIVARAEQIPAVAVPFGLFAFGNIEPGHIAREEQDCIGLLRTPATRIRGEGLRGPPVGSRPAERSNAEEAEKRKYRVTPWPVRAA